MKIKEIIFFRARPTACLVVAEPIDPFAVWLSNEHCAVAACTGIFLGDEQTVTNSPAPF